MEGETTVYGNVFALETFRLITGEGILALCDGLYVRWMVLVVGRGAGTGGGAFFGAGEVMCGRADGGVVVDGGVRGVPAAGRLLTPFDCCESGLGVLYIPWDIDRMVLDEE